MAAILSWRVITRLYCKIDVFRGCLESGTLAAISSLLATRAHRELIDFDNHLDNITLDWKNLQINELLKQTLYS